MFVPSKSLDLLMFFIVVFFLFHHLKCKVIVRFVDICGIVAHNCCLYFLLLMYIYIMYERNANCKLFQKVQNILTIIGPQSITIITWLCIPCWLSCQTCNNKKRFQLFPLSIRVNLPLLILYQRWIFQNWSNESKIYILQIFPP